MSYDYTINDIAEKTNVSLQSCYGLIKKNREFIDNNSVRRHRKIYYNQEVMNFFIDYYQPVEERPPKAENPIVEERPPEGQSPSAKASRREDRRPERRAGNRRRRCEGPFRPPCPQEERERKACRNPDRPCSGTWMTPPYVSRGPFRSRRNRKTRAWAAS